MKQCPQLVIDASYTTLFTGLLNPDGSWLDTQSIEGPALETLFQAVNQLIDSTQTELQNIEQFVYCAGPGSTLGLRLCAMAIETWSRLKTPRAQLSTYQSLDLAAFQIIKDHPHISNFTLISDWKKNFWNCIHVNNGQLATIQQTDHIELAANTNPIFHLPQRKGWLSAPPNAQTIEYRPENLPEALKLGLKLKTTKQVELFNAGSNTFAKWVPERHRTPSTPANA